MHLIFFRIERLIGKKIHQCTKRYIFVRKKCTLCTGFKIYDANKTGFDIAILNLRSGTKAKLDFFRHFKIKTFDFMMQT